VLPLIRQHNPSLRVLSEVLFHRFQMEKIPKNSIFATNLQFQPICSAAQARTSGCVSLLIAIA
jgi:hypothetical protein